MSQKDILEQLREALLEEAASNPTAGEVEEFMTAPADSSPGTLERMRKQFVEKVLGKLQPEPAKQVGKEITFGQWVEEVRKKAHLTHSFVATALGESTSFVERFEKGETLPWAIPAIKGSEIAILFRIHFNALRELTANSHKALEYLPETRHPSLTPDDLQSRNPPPSEGISDEINNWLEEVRRNLEEKQATYLLD